jgi:hypothetical protein
MYLISLLMASRASAIAMDRVFVMLHFSARILVTGAGSAFFPLMSRISGMLLAPKLVERPGAVARAGPKKPAATIGGFLQPYAADCQRQPASTLSYQKFSFQTLWRRRLIAFYRIETALRPALMGTTTPASGGMQ